MRWLLCTLCLFTSSAMSKPLIVGTMLFEPPYEQQLATKDFTGFDIDLMRAICARLHKECVFKGSDFSQIFDDLQSKKIDIAISALIITENRKKEFIFSIPYLASQVQFITLTENPIQATVNLNGNKVGILKGAYPAANYLRKNYGDNVAIIPYPALPELLEALSDKKVDLLLVDAFYGDYWITTPQSPFKVVGDKILLGSGYGIMTTAKNAALIKDINRALLSIQADGTYAEIYSRYFH